MPHIDFMRDIVGEVVIKMVLPFPAKAIRWFFERNFVQNPRSFSDIYGTSSIRDTLINVVFWGILIFLIYFFRKIIFE
jgi:hypothetical protein